MTLLMVGGTADSQTATNTTPVDLKPKPPPGVVQGMAVNDRLWSFEFGVGVISDNTPADYLEGDIERLDGPGGGLTYNFTFSRQCSEFDWRIGRIHLHPQWERVAMLTIVDENTGRIIPDLNVGLVFRWQDFPWNRFVRTTLAAGAGFSYSFQIWTADKQRHPGEDRSRIKFWMPIEFTAALPCERPKWSVHPSGEIQLGHSQFSAVLTSPATGIGAPNPSARLDRVAT